VNNCCIKRGEKRDIQKTATKEIQKLKVSRVIQLNKVTYPQVKINVTL
jgi:hypothetical protein